MIIECGKRRILSYKWGWKIEIQHVPKSGKHKGKVIWAEDRPAWPANLAQALEMVCERELMDMGTTPVPDLEKALVEASGRVRRYMQMAREAA